MCVAITFFKVFLPTHNLLEHYFTYVRTDQLLPKKKMGDIIFSVAVSEFREQIAGFDLITGKIKGSENKMSRISDHSDPFEIGMKSLIVLGIVEYEDVASMRGSKEAEKRVKEGKPIMKRGYTANQLTIIKSVRGRQAIDLFHTCEREIEQSNCAGRREIKDSYLLKPDGGVIFPLAAKFLFLGRCKCFLPNYTFTDCTLPRRFN